MEICPDILREKGKSQNNGYIFYFKKSKSPQEKTKGKTYNIYQFVNGFLFCFLDRGLQAAGVGVGHLL